MDKPIVPIQIGSPAVSEETFKLQRRETPRQSHETAVQDLKRILHHLDRRNQPPGKG